MADSKPLDIILDMVVGPTSEQKPVSRQSVDSTDPYVDCTKALVPLGDIVNSGERESANTSAKGSASNFSFKKSLAKIFNFKKPSSSKKISAEFTPYSASTKNTLGFYCSLRKEAKKYHISNHNPAIDLLGFDLDFNTFRNNIKNIINNGEKNPNENNPSNEEGLQLFFNYVIKITSEFSEEEILDLETRIMKLVRNIKGRRELKHHIRRYATAMNFKDPLFFTDLKCNHQ